MRGPSSSTTSVSSNRRAFNVRDSARNNPVRIGRIPSHSRKYTKAKSGPTKGGSVDWLTHVSVSLLFVRLVEYRHRCIPAPMPMIAGHHGELLHTTWYSDCKIHPACKKQY